MTSEEKKPGRACSEEETTESQRVSDDIFSGKPTPEEMKELRQAVDAHKAAQRQLTEALGVLWNSQVDVAKATGRVEQLRVALSQRLKFFDDCSCRPCDLRPPGPSCW